MYEIVDAADKILLAEAETLGASRLAAQTIHDEGQDLPILIKLNDNVVARLVDGVWLTS
jgi:hypothetical protein